MRVGFVVPRYGLEVLGGAEYGARMLAERLVSQLGWPVDVFTTCATDAVTWQNDYPAARTELNGVGVHRFRSVSGRDARFDDFVLQLGDPRQVSDERAMRFIDLQGPVCPDAVNAAVDGDAQVIVFYPYLYYPSVKGIPLAGARAVFHPAAHDEPWLRLPVFRPVFESAGALVFQTQAERALVEGLFNVAHRPQLVLGLGVEARPADAEAARTQLGLGDAPFLLCLGRVEDGKGTSMLARFFAAYKARHPGPLKLILVGNVVDPPAGHPDIVLAGAVADAIVWSALAGASALVQPSYLEAFSLALMEGWSAGLPAIVNGCCPALREHCLKSRGGVWFTDYASFEAAVDLLLADPNLGAELGASGARYVEGHFSWPALIRRYGMFLERVAERAAVR